MNEAVQGTDEPREVELKLECDGAGLMALMAHPLLGDVAAAEPQRLRTCYYDTPGRALREADLTLRIRTKDGRHVQTVKAGSDQIGLFDRAEWESEVPGDAPDPAAWADTAAEPVLAEAKEALEPLFTTVIARRVHPISFGESRIAVTLDDGRIESASGDALLCEVELELESGRVADLFSLAQALSEAAPLRLAVLSKSARGFAVLDREAPPRPRPTRWTCRPRMMPERYSAPLPARASGTCASTRPPSSTARAIRAPCTRCVLPCGGSARRSRFARRCSRTTRVPWF
ncbi:CYTH domain-containing protein [Methylobacterium komagatae]|uniref:CYTH domain-containing protein n=1 Tax=Methylobacterium komagatae TaxID=374425 RepID=A0ABW2BGQ1_9HYPH